MSSNPKPAPAKPPAAKKEESSKGTGKSGNKPVAEATPPPQPSPKTLPKNPSKATLQKGQSEKSINPDKGEKVEAKSGGVPAEFEGIVDKILEEYTRLGHLLKETLQSQMAYLSQPNVSSGLMASHVYYLCNEQLCRTGLGIVKSVQKSIADGLQRYGVETAKRCSKSSIPAPPMAQSSTEKSSVQSIEDTIEKTFRDKVAQEKKERGVQFEVVSSEGMEHGSGPILTSRSTNQSTEKLKTPEEASKPVAPTRAVPPSIISKSFYGSPSILPIATRNRQEYEQMKILHEYVGQMNVRAKGEIQLKGMGSLLFTFRHGLLRNPFYHSWPDYLVWI